MKKIVSALLLVLLLGMVCIPGFAATSASLTGPDTVRAGDTITVTFKLNGSGIYGISGTLEYDADQLTLTGTSQKIASPWMVEFNGDNFVAYDNNLSTPINNNASIFTATFRVKSGLATGTQIQVSVKDIVATDGSADQEIGTASYVKTIAAPKSTDNTLKSLTVGNATISPAFSPEITAYTAQVPYEVNKLELSYETNDSKATVTVNNPTLKVAGTTDVTIQVTSESGSVKTYTIQVTRAQDPNYQPSGNNALSNIFVEGFQLSPYFSAEVTQYIVWLPYETENVVVRGTAADSKATVTVEGGSDLVAGADNAIRVICTAENGDQKVYTIIAKRAAAHDGGDGPAQPEVVYHTVFWVVDGNVTAETYEAGSLPAFTGSTDKASDECFTYTFAGWHTEIVAVSGDAVYVATYTKTVIEKEEQNPDPQPSTPSTEAPGQNVTATEETGIGTGAVVVIAILCVVVGCVVGLIVPKKTQAKQ